MNIAILASTNGTDLQAIIDEMKAGNMPGIDLKFVLVNVDPCGAAEKARNAGIPVIFLNPKDSSGKPLSREVYDKHLDKVCKMYDIDLIVLVGWMRILSAWFVKQYPKRIINVHPSLLPKYPGMDLDVHAAVIKADEKESGMTIHYVDEKVDHGEIILQKKISIAPNETPETLKVKVQALEKKWYPEVIKRLAVRV